MSIGSRLHSRLAAEPETASTTFKQYARVRPCSQAKRQASRGNRVLTWQFRTRVFEPGFVRRLDIQAGRR